MYKNFDECLEYVEDYMIKHGPFDGVLGFSMVGLLKTLITSPNIFMSRWIFYLLYFLASNKLTNELQGATLAAAMPGMQAEVQQTLAVDFTKGIP